MNISSRTIEAAVASAAILMSMSSSSVAHGPEIRGASRHLRIHPAHVGSSYGANLGFLQAASLDISVEESETIPVVSVLEASSRPTPVDVRSFRRIVDQPSRIYAAPISQRPAFPNLEATGEMVAWAKQLWSSFPEDARLPAIWSDEGEIAFEWKWGKRHAILSIEEDGTVGYAMLDGERFSPGREIGSLDSFPPDLLNYLKKA